MIKYIICFIISTFQIFTVYSQVRDQYKFGHFIGGGSLSIDLKNIEQTSIPGDELWLHRRFNFTSDLHVGIFVSKYILTGIKAEYIIEKTNANIQNAPDLRKTIIENNLLFGPIIRAYTPIGLFGEASFGKGFFEIGDDDPWTTSEKIYAWNIGLGYSLFLNENIAIEPIISYKVKSNENSFNQTLEKHKGLNIIVCIQYYFNIFK